MVQAVDSTEKPTWEGTLERAEVYVYLTRLRASENAPNMMGASMYLQEEFGFDKKILAGLEMSGRVSRANAKIEKDRQEQALFFGRGISFGKRNNQRKI